jgi:hypothetical protein
MIVLLDCYYAVVPLRLFLLPLFAFDDANTAAFQEASRKCRFVHQNEHINWVAILGLSATRH